MTRGRASHYKLARGSQNYLPISQESWISLPDTASSRRSQRTSELTMQLGRWEAIFSLS